MSKRERRTRKGDEKKRFFYVLHDRDDDDDEKCSVFVIPAHNKMDYVKKRARAPYKVSKRKKNHE